MIERLAHVIVDALLPGDEDAGLPAASEVGVNDALVAALKAPDLSHQRVVSAVARQLGGAHEFLHATPDQRIAALRAVEKEMPVAFRALVVFALEAYYQSDAVVLAFGWRTDPPQPLGHPLEPHGLSLLELVRAHPTRV